MSTRATTPRRRNLFWRQLVQAHRVFNIFRARFLGKCSPAHFFWGSFDLAVTRFSGRAAPPIQRTAPHVGLWVMQEAYSHEVSSAGFWPGNGGYGQRGVLLLRLSGAGRFCAGGRWKAQPTTATLGEFCCRMMRCARSASPDETLLDFMQASYAGRADRGKWDRAALERYRPCSCMWRRSWQSSLALPQRGLAQTAPALEPFRRLMRCRAMRRHADPRRPRSYHSDLRAISARRSPIRRSATHGNNLACTNCHAPGRHARNSACRCSDCSADFPQYSARSRRRDHDRGPPQLLHDAQHERPRAANDAPEMQAMVAYIKFLSTGVAPGETLPGLGSGHMPELHARR